MDTLEKPRQAKTGMTLTLPSNVSCKKGTLPKGASVVVTHHEEFRGLYARMTGLSTDDEPLSVNIKYSHLHVLFPDVFLGLDENEIEEGLSDGEINSIVGGQCYEQDGYDEDGWPSLLMAYGFI